ncbi:3-hydroxyacyl-CoA dehydrogenase family protein [Saccharopolyspora gloriosae]|uniref:3-hydroxybutyryl-CoA dehydrogenase n=1 Tax=Saccharopolyspora gloriosae TaxID=455344 RepID=A0A840NLG0_9PSEU|nr:3-hydroxyacyl-CoA dehydrogenase family protein [Saccharopolyspora gloriosae]MBB5069097.1 3-hydroxybutyryl-CoA dehydrogenase [Saccharopolyspora gloriosae]
MTTSAIPAKVAVIGGGRMGSGIAQTFAIGGAEVSIVESSESAAGAAREKISAAVARAAQRGKLADPDELLGRVAVLTGIAALPGDAELVVEAVPELAETKVEVLSGAERVVGPDAVLASNTSSLSIAGLSAALQRPERFLGMHYFNPVPASKLVELVAGPDTTDAVLGRARDWVRGLGKAEVMVRDSPGFATSRLGVLLGLEAIRMLEEGVADAASVDSAMELGYRHPMGPLRSTDLVGLDVRLAIAEHLHATLGERFAPPQLLRDKVARGELGRKTGRGFHDWE